MQKRILTKKNIEKNDCKKKRELKKNCKKSCKNRILQKLVETPNKPGYVTCNNIFGIFNTQRHNNQK